MSEFTEKDVELIERLLSHGILFPAEFKNRLRELIFEGMKKIPYDQFIGSQLIQGKAVRTGGDDGVSSDTGGVYVSCSPAQQVTGLADGRYIVMFGGALGGATGSGFRLGISVNGDTPVDTEALLAVTAFYSGGRALQRDLDNDHNNTLELKVKGTNASSAGLAYGWISVLRLGSL